jgi:hypothetical protein
MTYKDGVKNKGWAPKGRKNDKKLSSFDDSRDSYWTEIADQFLNSELNKDDIDKIDKKLGE